MNKNNKEVQGYLPYNRLFNNRNKMVKLKMNMMELFRRKFIVHELPENRFVEYNYSMRAGDGSFHEAIKIVLCITQFFGIMPVCGILNLNINRIKFKWLSLRTIYTLILIFFGSYFTGSKIYEVFTTKSNLRFIVNTIYTGSALLYFYIFLNLAREWPKIIRKWRKIEDKFLYQPYTPCNGYTLVRKIRFVGLIMILIIISENLFYVATISLAVYEENMKCNPDMNFLEFYFKKHRKHLLLIIDYHDLFFIVTQCYLMTIFFCWNYADIFITLVSIGLAHRFNQINQRLAEIKGKKKPIAFWMEIRTNYLALVQLLELIDTKLSFLIPILFFNDVFSICWQLFNSFSVIPVLSTKIYFYYSMLFYVTRILLMLFCASAVHDSTKIPLVYLRRVPRKSWNLEVERFYELVTHNTFGLSGKKFFYITKSLILAIVSTIVTYEIILFTKADRNEHSRMIC